LPPDAPPGQVDDHPRDRHRLAGAHEGLAGTQADVARGGVGDDGAAAGDGLAVAVDDLGLEGVADGAADPGGGVGRQARGHRQAAPGVEDPDAGGDHLAVARLALEARAHAQPPAEAARPAAEPPVGPPGDGLPEDEALVPRGIEARRLAAEGPGAGRPRHGGAEEVVGADASPERVPEEVGLPLHLDLDGELRGPVRRHLEAPLAPGLEGPGGGAQAHPVPTQVGSRRQGDVEGEGAARRQRQPPLRHPVAARAADLVLDLAGAGEGPEAAPGTGVGHPEDPFDVDRVAGAVGGAIGEEVEAQPLRRRHGAVAGVAVEVLPVVATSFQDEEGPVVAALDPQHPGRLVGAGRRRAARGQEGAAPGGAHDAVGPGGAGPDDDPVPVAERHAGAGEGDAALEARRPGDDLIGVVAGHDADVGDLDEERAIGAGPAVLPAQLAAPQLHEEGAGSPRAEALVGGEAEGGGAVAPDPGAEGAGHAAAGDAAERVAAAPVAPGAPGLAQGGEERLRRDPDQAQAGRPHAAHLQGNQPLSAALQGGEAAHREAQIGGDVPGAQGPPRRGRQGLTMDVDGPRRDADGVGGARREVAADDDPPRPGLDGEVRGNRGDLHPRLAGVEAERVVEADLEPPGRVAAIRVAAADLLHGEGVVGRELVVPGARARARPFTAEPGGDGEALPGGQGEGAPGPQHDGPFGVPGEERRAQLGEPAPGGPGHDLQVGGAQAAPGEAAQQLRRGDPLVQLDGDGRVGPRLARVGMGERARHDGARRREPEAHLAGQGRAGGGAGPGGDHGGEVGAVGQATLRLEGQGLGAQPAEAPRHGRREAQGRVAPGQLGEGGDGDHRLVEGDRHGAGEARLPRRLGAQDPERRDPGRRAARRRRGCRRRKGEALDPGGRGGRRRARAQGSDPGGGRTEGRQTGEGIAGGRTTPRQPLPREARQAAGQTGGDDGGEPATGAEGAHGGPRRCRGPLPRGGARGREPWLVVPG
jgi:hypothetical protein